MPQLQKNKIPCILKFTRKRCSFYRKPGQQEWHSRVTHSTEFRALPDSGPSALWYMGFHGMFFLMFDSQILILTTSHF